MSAAALRPEPHPIVACTISRDVQAFDLLIEDMEANLGESWGDLGFPDALAAAITRWTPAPSGRLT